MTAKILTMPQEPTTQERYKHLRENAECFVSSMKTMVESLERDGNKEWASRLKVWALMPWQAAIKCDDNGELWPVCEACLQPIKNEAERISGDACDFHKKCVGQ